MNHGLNYRIVTEKEGSVTFQNIPENCVFERKESFSLKFMVIGIIAGRGVLLLIEVPDKTKVDSQFYIDHVLTPLVYKYLPQLYPNDI
jgi:hypothetical protein